MRTMPINFNILLEQVNKVRLACAIGEGKIEELPKGITGDANQCVLARALSNGWEPEVSDAGIDLRYAHEPCPDFELIANQLRKMGFKGVSVIYEDAYIDSNNDEWVEGSAEGVCFRPTKNMQNLIYRFDRGELPHLILND